MSAIDEITDFQLNVARRWIEEGQSVPQPHFKYVAYFGALNALYWLWGMAEEEREQANIVLEEAPEHLRNKIRSRRRRLPGEAQLINHLVEKIGEGAATVIATEHAEYISFVTTRLAPS
jgi:hypothetical protein